MIECTHVYKRYKSGTNALYDINLDVDQGEFVYIIGATGSGKSSLIMLIDGEEKDSQSLGVDSDKVSNALFEILEPEVLNEISNLEA